MPEIWLVLKHHYSCQMVEWRLPPHVFPSLESRLQAFLFDNLSKNVSATDRRCGSKKTCRVWTQAVFLYSLHNNLYHCRTIFWLFYVVLYSFNQTSSKGMVREYTPALCHRLVHYRILCSVLLPWLHTAEVNMTEVHCCSCLGVTFGVI